jgi:hypothetical protein
MSPARSALITGYAIFLATAAPLISHSAMAADEPTDWGFQTYVDAGYGASNRDAANPAWPGKSSTTTLNSAELFLAMGNIRKQATPDSRWGFELGLQAGEDSEGLVTSAPPPANEPVSNADTLRHLYRANVSWDFGGDHSVRLTGGLINSYIGYESFLAIDNPNHTRGYIADTVPYFLLGLETLWNATENVDIAFYLLDSFNYLTDPNDTPSAGLQVKWRTSPRTTLIQNLYYGPDQAETSIEYWRFFTDTILEWKTDRWLLAAAFDYGSEKQAHLPGQPRASWWSGAIWASWAIDERMSLSFRPEFYHDDDGLITGAAQTLHGYTTTFKYQLSPRHQRLVGSIELRYDRSSGDGGFPDGPDNQLQPDQTLLLIGVQWMFEP